MRTLIALVLCLSFSVLFAQKEERRMISEFNELSVIGLIEVELTPGDEPAILIISEGVPMERIVTDNDGPKLKLSMKPGFYQDVKVVVKLTYSHLDAIRLQAGAELYSDYIVEGERLEVRVGSGSQIDVEVDIASLYVKVGEGSKAILTGVTTYEEVSVGTGGQLYADRLNADHIKVKINTGGEAEVYAEASIDGKVNTGGDLAIYGEPESDHVRTSLGGSVRRIMP